MRRATSKIEKTVREKIVESSVIIGAILIFIGFLKQYWFYSHFGIAIQQYLTLDEILILFFAEIVYILKLTLFLLLYLLSIAIIGRIISSRQAKKNKGHINENEDESELDSFFDALFMGKKGAVLIVSIIAVIITYILFICHQTTFTVLLLSLMCLQCTIFFINWLTNTYDEDFTMYTAFLIGLFVLLLCKNKIDINETQNQFTKIQYSIELNDRTINTSKDTLYLGKTKDYLYLFDNKSKQSIILKTENLNSIKERSVK